MKFVFVRHKLFDGRAGFALCRAFRELGHEAKCVNFTERSHIQADVIIEPDHARDDVVTGEASLPHRAFGAAVASLRHPAHVVIGGQQKAARAAGGIAHGLGRPGVHYLHTGRDQRRPPPLFETREVRARAQCPYSQFQPCGGAAGFDATDPVTSRADGTGGL